MPARRTSQGWAFLVTALSVCALGSCARIPFASPPIQDGKTDERLTATVSPTRPPTSTWTAAPVVPSPTVSPTATPSLTPTVSATWTPSQTPTPVVLRGEVNVERLSCRYGPGPMYLYLYALVKGAVQEVIGRTDSGSWVLTRARGSQTACWVNARYLTLNGDVMLLDLVYPDKYRLPVSPYYSPPYNVHAVRSGNTVTITWNAEALRAGDEEYADSPRFVVETWVCRGGTIVFTPLAAYDTIVTVTDEPGCSEPSHGRVFLAEKHGYAGPTEISWP